MPDRTLGPDGRLRAIYRPNDHGPAGTDPSGSIEEFRTVAKALDIFSQRIRTGRSRYYPAATYGAPVLTDWPTADETGLMDVWVEVPVKGQRPTPPDCPWQRWSWRSGRIHRDDF